MKRSEVVEKIKQDLIHAFLRNDGITRDCCERTAKYILESLEEIGMMPPYNPGEEPFGYNEGYISPPKWDEQVIEYVEPELPSYISNTLTKTVRESGIVYQYNIGYTLEDIATHCGCTRERIRQILRKVVRRGEKQSAANDTTSGSGDI